MRASNSSNSPRLAREHEHCGCASMTRVARSVARAGHCRRASAAAQQRSRQACFRRPSAPKGRFRHCRARPGRYRKERVCGVASPTVGAILTPEPPLRVTRWCLWCYFRIGTAEESAVPAPRAFPEHVEHENGTSPHTRADVQNAQRRAAMGTSLRHSGHFFVVGSGGASPRFLLATIALRGTTIKK